MFMESITSEVISIIAQICVVILSTFGTILIGKVQKKIETSRKKDEVDIVNKVTDEAVVSVEMENPDLDGASKKKKAVEKSKEILAEKGVKTSDAHIEQSIEEGVFKMNVSKGKYTPEVEDGTNELRQTILDGSEEEEEEEEEEVVNEVFEEEIRESDIEVEEEVEEEKSHTFSSRLKDIGV